MNKIKLTKKNKRFFAWLMILVMLLSINPYPYIGGAAAKAQTKKASGVKKAETEENDFFANTELRKMLEDNYAEVQEKGYAELRIPRRLHGINNDVFLDNANYVANTLINAGYDAYIIGGGTRDLIMGTETNDFDLATNATIEEQQRLFGTALGTHTDEAGRVFGYVSCGEGDDYERVDLCTYQNIPKQFHGKEGVPDFDIENYTLTSNSLLFDSFQRDLTMNAIYYDMKTGELVDFHAGIYAIWKKFIAPIFDTATQSEYNPEIIIRAMRFKAKYGYDFNENIDSALRANGDAIVKSISKYQMAHQTNNMWGKGYSYECYRILRDYGVLDEVFPCVEDIYQTDEYDAYVTRALKATDANYKTDDKFQAVACILWPAVEKDMEEEDKSLKDSIFDLLFNLYKTYQFESSSSTGNQRDHLVYLLTEIGLKAEDADTSDFLSNQEVIDMVEANQKEVEKNGYSELRIPMSLHGITRESFSDNANYVADTLMKAGFEAYMIGGATRDLIMGTDSDDFDLVTNASVEQQEELFGDSFGVHEGAEGRIFGFVFFPDERIDLVTYQNIPKAYHGLEGVPDFDIENYSFTSDKLVNDSFQRDLPMNAIYYDMQNGDLVDFHAGIYDLMKKRISAIVDAGEQFKINPEQAVRAMRFKGKYGFEFTDEIDKTLKENGEEIVASLDTYQMMNQTNRMWGKGYSYNCYQVLNEYNVLDEIFTPIKDVYDSVTYREEVGNAIKRMDKEYEDYGQYQAIVYILYPVVEKNMETKGLTLSDSIEAVLDELEETYDYREGQREQLESGFYAMAEGDSGKQGENEGGKDVDPAATETPEVTEAPVATVTPEVTETPAATETAAATVTPVVTATPLVTASPAITVDPKTTVAPVNTATPVVAKKNNIIKVSGKNAIKKAVKITVKAKKIKKKAKVIKVVQSAGVKLTFTNKTKSSKLKKYLVYTNGKVKLKKKAPKGTYKFILSSKANTNYNAAKTKTITLKVA